MTRSLTTAAACAAALLIAASCGSDSDSTDSSDTSTTVTSVPSPAVTTALAPVTTAAVTTIPAAVTITPTTVAETPTTAAATATTAAPRVVSSPSDNVRRGDTGPGVAQIQTALKAAGYDLEADGIFGPVTDRAVRDYQASNGLTVDGVVGQNTWAKLGAAATAETTTSTTTA